MSGADIGVVGLAVMGENLVLNMAGKGFTVAVYNRTTSKVDAFKAGRGSSDAIIACHDYPSLLRALKKPRKVMLMVKAGQAVDDAATELIGLMEPGDIIVDGGNSHFADTERRLRLAEARGVRYIGAGVSGGEEGALTGPSIMPGGSADAWPDVRDLYQAISAKVKGVPCCEWIGPGGSGHFVKMVHNGIEYGDMQLIAESYFFLKEALGLPPDLMAKAFASWNEGDLSSYLVEITARILQMRDDDGAPLLDRILDVAGQKGTGKWTGISALDFGVPLTLISEAVFARYLSAAKDERIEAALRFPRSTVPGSPQVSVDDVARALYAAKIVSYAQGYLLLKEASAASSWDLDFGGIALLWRGGCIIRSSFLERIKEAYDREPGLPNLILDPFFADKIASGLPALRRLVASAALRGIAAPAFSSALAYLDGYSSADSPANLIQAQRDYFGAHTYERTDRPRGTFFHTDWLADSPG